MKKKFILVLVLSVLLTGAVFSQHKYNSFDMLLGINYGLGVTTNVYHLFSMPWPVDNYAATVDFGLNYDFYILPWLSVSSGLSSRAGLYFFLDREINDDDNDLMDVTKTPVSISIPLQVHVNVPNANFLYIGGGVNFNIPVYQITVSGLQVGNADINFGERGKFFISTPIELGFDFVKENKGGSRFILRFAPEFHDEGTIFPVGFIWQNNFRLYSRK